MSSIQISNGFISLWLFKKRANQFHSVALHTILPHAAHSLARFACLHFYLSFSYFISIHTFHFRHIESASLTFVKFHGYIACLMMITGCFMVFHAYHNTVLHTAALSSRAKAFPRKRIRTHYQSILFIASFFQKKKKTSRFQSIYSNNKTINAFKHIYNSSNGSNAKKRLHIVCRRCRRDNKILYVEYIYSLNEVCISAFDNFRVKR